MMCGEGEVLESGIDELVELLCVDCKKKADRICNEESNLNKIFEAGQYCQECQNRIKLHEREQEEQEFCRGEFDER